MNGKSQAPVASSVIGQERTAGTRFSSTDALAIGLCGAAVWLLWVVLGEELSWSGVLIVQIPITLAVILAEMRSPAYHGIFSRRLKP